VAHFLEHDRTGGQLNYLNLDQVVMAEYYTIGRGEPLLILRLADGMNYEMEGSTAEQVANLIRNNTVARISTQRS
jgi:hypothetical protein